MVYVYNATTNRYFMDDNEITKDEYTEGVAKIKEAFTYALKKFQGETVEIPTELVELVEIQIAALEANIPNEMEELTETEEKARAYDIIMGVGE